jgi:hypothetical protein
VHGVAVLSAGRRMQLDFSPVLNSSSRIGLVHPSTPSLHCSDTALVTASTSRPFLGDHQHHRGSSSSSSNQQPCMHASFRHGVGRLKILDRGQEIEAIAAAKRGYGGCMEGEDRATFTHRSRDRLLK